MEPKEGVGGRLGQSFDILKKDFIKLGLPIFVYNFLSFAFVGAVVMVLAFKMLKGMDFNSTDWISFYSNPKTIIALSTSIVLFIVYLIAYIPVTLGLFKGIKQSIAGKEITVKENLLYGVSRLLSAFKTYWYIFAYVALIPALMFILAGLLIIVGYIAEIGALVSIGGIIMSISMIVFLVFALLRGIKSTFAIYSAVDSDQFTKENFEASIKSTDGNWWRIVGNFLLAGLVVWLISFIGTIYFHLFLLLILERIRLKVQKIY